MSCLQIGAAWRWATLDVPDPYYADDARFDDVLAMIENACGALFQQLEPAIRSPRSGGSS